MVSRELRGKPNLVTRGHQDNDLSSSACWVAWSRPSMLPACPRQVRLSYALETSPPDLWGSALNLACSEGDSPGHVSAIDPGYSSPGWYMPIPVVAGMGSAPRPWAIFSKRGNHRPDGKSLGVWPLWVSSRQQQCHGQWGWDIFCQCSCVWGGDRGGALVV